MSVGFDQYHEPASELSQETRTFARMIVSMIEEAEAIDWYEQRMSLEQDQEAKAIMHDAQKEEFKHFGMDLEFLLRKKPEWRVTLKDILFTSGSIVKSGKQAEKDQDNVSAGDYAAGNPNSASHGSGSQPKSQGG